MGYLRSNAKMRFLFPYLYNKKVCALKPYVNWLIFILSIFLYSCAPSPQKTVESFITALNNMEYEKALSYVEESSDMRAGLMELIEMTAMVDPNRVNAVRDSLKKGLKKGAFQSYRVIRENKISDLEAIVALEEIHENILGMLVVDTIYFQLKKVKGKWLIVKEINYW
ncbi:MAG: hypothetical protein ABIM32_04485 [candidate division WOR-3 bacterium]